MMEVFKIQFNVSVLNIKLVGCSKKGKLLFEVS